MGWTKLFSEIVTSSIWSEDDKTRIVWITILALKDMRGFVPAAIPGLANAARVSVDECKAALAKLESPDEYSRTPDYDGRRIVKVDGGWQVLNHSKYRDGVSSDPETSAARERMRRMRERKEEEGDTEDTDTDTDTDTVLRNDTVTHRNVTPELRKPDKRIPESLEIAKAYGVEIGMPAADVESFYDHFASNGWKVSGKAPMKDWKAAMRNWHRNSAGYVRAPSNRTPVPVAPPEYTDHFETVWVTYPAQGRVEKPVAYAAWNEALPRIEALAQGDLKALVLRRCRAIKEMAAGSRWQDQGGKFIPKLATWIKTGGMEE